MMAEKSKHLKEALQKKKETPSHENNTSANSYLNISSPRSENGAVIRRHKTAPLTPRSNSYGIPIGRHKKTDMESLRAVATSSGMKQNSATEKSCSPSHVKGHTKSLCTYRETNNSSRMAQPPKRLISASDNVIFFKELWNSVVNRYPEWVQRIWRMRQKERMAEFLQETSKLHTGDETLNHSKNDEESMRDTGNVLTPISEEHHDSLFGSFSASEFMDLRDEDSPVTHCEQRSFSSRSLERNGLEFSKVCDKVIEWREWSLQLTSDGKLIITGKSEQNTLSKSQDVSSWERVDAHTLRHRIDGTTYKLVGAADHFVCQDLPSYVRTKFQYGFPEKWLEIKNMWMKYRKGGNPPNFVWSPDTDYNRIKPRLNKTFTGSISTDKVRTDHISNNSESVYSKMQHIKRNVSGKEGKIELQKRETMRDVSNITHKRPLHKAHSFSVLSPKASNETTMQQRVSANKESTKENNKKLKASRKTKTEPQVLKKWYPLLFKKGLKFSGVLESGQSEVKCTTDTIVTADVRTQIVSCTSGERYKLVGDLHANACTAPEFIKKKFKIGVPHRWKVVVQEWIDVTEHSQDSQEEQESAESDEYGDVQEIALESLAATGNLKKSKRGRVIVPPLQHWLGERVTVYGDSSVYCPSPYVSVKLPSTEQLDLKSPHAKKKKCETPIASGQEVKKTGIKTRLYFN